MRDFAQHPRLRVAALTLCSAGAIIRGLAYIDPPRTGFTTFVDAWVPLHVWAIVWITAGALMLAGIWHRIVARWALAVGVGLWGAWAVSYYLSWLIGDSSRGWVTGSAFALIAGLHWIIGSLADRVGPPPGPVIPEEGGTG